MRDGESVDFSTLVGKTLVSIVKNNDDELLFETTEGEKYLMYHSQSCCESVTIEDICGDLEDLIDKPILVAEEVTSKDETPNDMPIRDGQYSFTWTFYKIDTAKGGVTIRWYGSSNGCYSESVDFVRVI